MTARKAPEKAEPNLGCATTRELLEEIATRMVVGATVGTVGSQGQRLGVMCYESSFNLDASVLDYRTVDS